jgi:uncharacterized protein YcaQ
VPFARLGPIGRDAVTAALWGNPNERAGGGASGRARSDHEPGAAAFEYWSHAACVLPLEQWPWFTFRRRDFRKRGMRWHEVSEQACAEVLARLRADGPLTATELGGAKRGGPWWDWSATKVAVEWLLDIGEVACVRRRGWKRVYDLAERAIPGAALSDAASDLECLAHLVRLAGRALGVATRADLADYHRLKGEQVDAVLADSGLVPVAVEGWRAPAWADPAALESPPRGRHRTTLLSPFDSLIWDRARTQRVFGFRHRLECYVPRDRREHGYYAMPLLAGGRLVGRVDPARDGELLIARQVSLGTPTAVPAMATALWEAAAWVDCTDVLVEQVRPVELAEPLRRALSPTRRPH